MGGLLTEPLDVCVGGSGEEKELIEVALADSLGVAPGKAGVLDELVRRKGAERDNGDARLLGKEGESFSGGRLGFGHRNAREPSESNRAGRLQVKVVLREENAGTAFRDERRGVA